MLHLRMSGAIPLFPNPLSLLPHRPFYRYIIIIYHQINFEVANRLSFCHLCCMHAVIRLQFEDSVIHTVSMTNNNVLNRNLHLRSKYAVLPLRPSIAMYQYRRKGSPWTGARLQAPAAVCLRRAVVWDVASRAVGSRSRKEFWVESESVHFYRLRLRPRYKILNRY
jgi:hypothetical protein